jgi:hypothetical protein
MNADHYPESARTAENARIAFIAAAEEARVLAE